MSDEQPIDLDDLRRVSVKVREKTDDNWLADMVELACDEIARLREERRWVPVGERLPHVGPDEKVLVAWRYEDEPKESLVVSEAWHLRRGLFVDKEELEFPDVKFWMPLPPGPEGDG